MEQANIYAAFVKAQTGFAPALKSSTNPHFRSKYAALDACVEAVIDSLNANGIALLQKTHPDTSGVTVETVFVHSSGESMSGGILHVPASKADAQGYGSALTYARRYSLMAACGIAPEDDDGNAASKRPTSTARPTPEQQASYDFAGAIVRMASAANEAQLKAIYIPAFKAAKDSGDQAMQDKLTAAKDKRNAELSGPSNRHAKGTISGDPAEGDLSGIGSAKSDPTGKPADKIIGNIVHAFASIGFTIEALEAEYGKRIDEWTNADVDEAREIFKIKKAEHASKSGAI